MGISQEHKIGATVAAITSQTTVGSTAVLTDIDEPMAIWGCLSISRETAGLLNAGFKLKQSY